MTTGEMKVEPGELGNHRTQVSGIADDLAQAAAAGQSATPLGSDAFGIIGQVFAGYIQGTVTSAAHNLQATSDTARQLAGGVGRAGEAYQATDEGAGRELTRIRGEM